MNAPSEARFASTRVRAERRLLAKTLVDFDFSIQPSIDRKQIQELATLRSSSRIQLASKDDGAAAADGAGRADSGL